MADILVRQTPELVLPGDIDFACPHCGRICKTNPKTRGVKHSVPTCAGWDAVVATDDASEFLLLAGVVQRLQ